MQNDDWKWQSPRLHKVHRLAGTRLPQVDTLPALTSPQQCCSQALKASAAPIWALQDDNKLSHASTGWPNCHGPPYPRLDRSVMDHFCTLPPLVHAEWSVSTVGDPTWTHGLQAFTSSWCNQASIGRPKHREAHLPQAGVVMSELVSDGSVEPVVQ